MINNELAASAFFCGGTLIRRDVVMTAAHCLMNQFVYKNSFIDYAENEFNPSVESLYSVFAGAHNISTIASTNEPPKGVVRASVVRVVRVNFLKSKRITFL